MPIKLGLLGMWHSHADGIVRQASAHPGEFSLVGFHDPDPEVVAEKRKRWEPKIPGFRVFEKPEQLIRLGNLPRAEARRAAFTKLGT